MLKVKSKKGGVEKESGHLNPILVIGLLALLLEAYKKPATW